PLDFITSPIAELPILSISTANLVVVVRLAPVTAVAPLATAVVGVFTTSFDFRSLK
ncbi:unnamed protein product, partial [Sphenostylis stenocarpa]